MPLAVAGFQLILSGLVVLWWLYAGRQPRWPKRLAALLALLGVATAIAFLLAPVVAPLNPFFSFARFAAWGLFLYGTLLATGCAWIDRRRPRSALFSALAALVLAGVALFAFQVEPRRLELTRTNIVAPGLQRPLRVGVVADLQTDRPGEFERQALQRLKAAEPDLVIYCGDYVQLTHGLAPEAKAPAYERGLDALNQILREVDLRPPLGAYAVRGDVEPEFESWSRIFAGTGVECVDTTTDFALPGLHLTALSYGDSRSQSLERSDPEPAAFWLAFGHRPEVARSPLTADLIVAGHTHGGQVQLPWLGPLTVLSDIPRTWGAGGLVPLSNQRQLYISRGIGMERGAAPRLRFLCRPEVALLELTPATLTQSVGP
jgi:uncharacterized protein